MTQKTSAFGSIEVIRAPAALSGADREQYASEIQNCIERHRVRIVLDLSNMLLIDSAGLEMLLDYNEQCLRRGGEVVLAGANALCSDILHITGLDQQLNCHKDLRTALGSFAR